jgi:hypothetical protein
MLRLVVIGFLCLTFQVSHAQKINDNRRCKTFPTNKDIILDEAFDPGSLQLINSSDSLAVIEQRGENRFLVTSETNSEIEVCYRVLPKGMTKPFSLINISNYDSSAAFRPNQPVGNPLFSKREQIFDMGELNHSGQLSRGITVGNTQDLFVNSSLNLSLDGQISEDLFIRASITDQFIPYQPEGNTQHLQDFDNVFVELYNDKFSVIGGDVVYKNYDTHFLKYYKNVQGGAVKVNHNTGTTGLGMSAAKGQFASVNVEVNEGVQGPYKVPSPNADQFVIIIANSEKVFLDGKLLARGFDQDYIIDYNQAEITFTSNVVITKYSRIRVDYEYSSRYYSRSVLNVNHEQKVGKLNILASYYREADNPNNPLLYDLSDEDKMFLKEVGNNLDSAVILSATMVPYSESKILYDLVDTVDQNLQPVRIFKYSGAVVDSLFSVTFNDFGSGKGSYRIKEYLAQGRIYEWVGPGKGNFEPYRKMVAPTKKEMVDLKLSLQTGEHSSIYIESAFSNQDLNLFSELDNEQNKGFAVRTGYRLADKPIANLSKSSFSFFTDVEFLNRDFRAIDRFRRVEFDRDWGYHNTDTIRTSDLVIRSGLKLATDIQNQISYGLSLRNKEDRLAGTQHELLLNKSIGKVQLELDGFLMNSDIQSAMTSWRKMNADLYWQGRVVPGYRFSMQQNTVKSNRDSVISSANYFSTHEIYLRNSARSKTRFELAYNIREDKAPIAGEMFAADYSKNIRFRLNRDFDNGHRLGMVFNYRFFDEYSPTSDVLESISGRLDWSGDLIQNVLRHELNYAVANTRVPRREYVFVEVPTGEGTHTWRDDNMDGVKDLDEFYEAVYFDERNYVKMYVNTTEFLDAYENILNYRANLRMPTSWRRKGGILSLLARISNTTSWSSNYRTTEESLDARLVPFLADIDENQVLSLREAIRSTFFINKSNPKFGMSFGYAKFRKKHLYSNGFEGRSDEEYNATFRFNINRKYNIKLSSLNAKRLNRSDYLAGRNYDINEYRLGPSFSWQPKPTLRITGAYNVGIKYSSNSAEDASQNNLNEVLTEIKIGKASSYSFNATVKYTNLVYDGDEFSPLGYEMLQGLRPGDNISWQLGWQQKLIAGLQLNLFYEGRRPDNSQVIHSGRASVSALF